MSKHIVRGAKVLPEDFVRVSREPVSNLDHLAQGSTIFVAGRRAGSYYARMRKRGFQLHQQHTTVDGIEGLALFAVPLAEERKRRAQEAEG